MNTDIARENRKKRLHQQIEEEERLIRIYEADWKVTRSRKRARSEVGLASTDDDDDDDDDEDDWLAALNALQSQDSGPAKLDTRWHDDPLLYRILPHVGGIAFRSAKPVGITRKEGAARYRCYEFEGNICCTDDGDMTKVDFCITMEVEFRDAAQVSRVEVALVTPSSEKQEELQDIIELVKETRNLPLFFRQLLNWSKFDGRRTQFLARFVADKIERPSPTLTRIHWHGTSHLDIRWQWKVDWASSGKDVLEIPECQPLADRSKGLKQLIEAVGGSCEKALSILLKTAAAAACPRE